MSRSSAATINADLCRLYTPVWQAAVAELPIARKLAAPLFVSVTHGYALARRRLLVVGKQSKLWPPRSEFAEWRHKQLTDLMDAYRQFAFGSDRPGAPFWSAAHQVRVAINPDSERDCMVWSNVIKIDEAGDQPSAEFEDWIGRYELLRHETRILEPDVVVFFTGPHFDGRIAEQIPGAAFEPHSKFVMRVQHPDLPRLSFRCYHPNWLRRSGNWAAVDELCALLSGL